MVNACPTFCSATFATYAALQSAITSYNGPADTYGDVNGWCFPKVTELSSLFSNTNFNHDISCWNVSHVTSMDSMFSYDTAFNQNIGSWDVSRVTTMNQMFNSASAFNQNISSWNVSSVTNMAYMFNFATAFNQNLCSWGPAMAQKKPAVTSMFGSTSCPEKNSPTLFANSFGPLCKQCVVTAGPTKESDQCSNKITHQRANK